MMRMELQVTGLNKSFGDKHVLKDVSFRVEGGRALGLLGRNGAGKTTTIRILTDIFRADSGRVLIDGQPINYNKVRIGYLPEERGLYPKVKVGAQMTYIGRLRGMTAEAAKQRAQDLLAELEAGEYWNKKLETLSKGNQQKIQLAISVIHNPDIVILDEPFSGLDPVNSQMLKDLILRQVELGKVVLFSSHQMPYVEEFCEHICILHQGTVVLDGRIRDIKRSYPRNRVEVFPEKPGLLEAVSKAPEWNGFVADIAVKEESFVLTLKDENEKKNLLRLITAYGGLDGFNVVEPTLQEIFVEKTGDAK
jgi:ABC-2 type transport system ATP-binding protein